MRDIGYPCLPARCLRKKLPGLTLMLKMAGMVIVKEEGAGAPGF